MAKAREKTRSGFRTLVALVLIAALVIFSLPEFSRRVIYPQKYSEFVQLYSEKYGVDPNLIYAVIKTESNFDPNACSDVGARGLMQLMEDAFEWVKYRMGDDREISYSDMYNPEYNIEYGTYLLKLLCEEFGDNETALAAYHSGRGSVNGWLEDSELSGDGNALDEIPSDVTRHYVNKVMRAYEGYNNLY